MDFILWYLLCLSCPSYHSLCQRIPSVKIIKTKIASLSLVVFLSSILIIGTGLTANAQQQPQQTQVFIVGADNAIHEANLKATKDGGDDVER
jgi:hypothetical protein